MAFILWVNGNESQSFSYFEEFVKLHPEPQPYLYALWNSPLVNLYYFSSEEKVKIQFLKNIVDGEIKTDGRLKAMACYALSRFYYKTNKNSEAKKYAEKIAAFKNWQIVGEFDNVSGSGFDKDYAPINQAKQDVVFSNKNDANVNWITPKSFKPEGWIDFAYLSTDLHNSIIYAQTFVNSPIEQDVMISTGVSGSLKIWLNDALIDGVSEERNTDLDVYNYYIHLNKGYNRLLLQIGDSEVSRANFMVRFTNESFEPIQGLTSVSTYQDYSKAGLYSKKMKKHNVEEYFEMELKKKESLINYLTLFFTYSHNGKIKESIELLRKAILFAPENTTLHQYLMTQLRENRMEEEASKEQNYIVENDPDNTFCMQVRFEEEVNKEDYDAAAKIVEKMEELYGENIYVAQYKIRVYSYQQKQKELLEAIDKYYKKYPVALYFVNLKAIIENELKNVKGVQQIWERFIKDNEMDIAIEKLYRYYVQSNNFAKAIKLYTDLVEKYPYATGYHNTLANIYYEKQEYANSLEMLKKVLESIPYSGKTWSDIAQVNEIMGNENDAKEALKKAVYYSPTNYDSKKKLRKMEGKKDVYSYFEQPDAYDIAKKAPNAKSYPDESTMLLLHEQQKIIYPEGGSETRTILLVKIFTSVGVEKWQEYSIGYNGNNQRSIVEKAEIIKANGTKIKADDNGDSFVFSGLEPGDCIYLNYRIEDYAGGKLAKHFWETFQLNYFMPTQKAKYSLLVPNDRKFEYKVINGDTKPKISEADEFKSYIWERNNPSLLLEEPLMPVSTDVVEILHFSSLPDWKFVANWYADLSAIKAKSEPEVINATKEALKGIEKGTDTDKAKAIYNYIIKNIVYSSVPFRQSAYVPQRASKTLNAKLGDCKDVSTLFVAMAKEAGLKANLVLVDTRQNGEKDMILPSISFNHCIAKTQLEGKEQYLELTWKHLPFASKTYALEDALILDIPTDIKDNAVSNLKKLDIANKMNITVRNSTVKVEGTNILVEKNTLKTGFTAAGMRDSYADLVKDEQEKNISSSISSEHKGQFKLLNLEFDDLNKAKDSLSYTIKYQVKNEVSNVGNLKILPIRWSDADYDVNYLSEEKRNFDIVYLDRNFTDNDRETMTITIPNGFSFVEIPTSKTLKFEDYMEYKITYESRGNTLIATRDFKLFKGIIPVDKYANFKEFLSQVQEEDTRQVGFK